MEGGTYYAGIDAHRSYLTVAIVDASGEVVRERKRVPIGDGDPLLEALEGLRPLKAVVETCPFRPWIHDTLEPTEVAAGRASVSLRSGRGGGQKAGRAASAWGG